MVRVFANGLEDWDSILIQLPGTLTPLAMTNLASGSTGPNPSLQQPLLSDRRLSLTVANSYLFTALGSCISSSSSGLVGNLTRKPFVWVSRQNRRRNPLTGDHSHPHLQNECPPSCHITPKQHSLTKFTKFPLTCLIVNSNLTSMN